MVRKRPIDPRAGQRLAEVRKLRRITQEELAAAVGVSGRTVQNYEAGRTAITLDVSKRFATVLDCEIADLAAMPGARVRNTTLRSERAF